SCPAATHPDTVIASTDDAAAWMTGFGSGDYTPTTGFPASWATDAQWRLGDPPTDIDGDNRPDRDATSDFIGADIP
ncbi:MAG: hypothetical protein V3V08_17720, partial [Nannocystaceae bacterium]